ncbi:MAG: hypothetical protein ACJAYU_005158 [Bradymonadia bacterium]|jgi:hypothetical protein
MKAIAAPYEAIFLTRLNNSDDLLRYDLETATIATVGGLEGTLHSAHGMVYVPDADRLYVADGRHNVLLRVDPTTTATEVVGLLTAADESDADVGSMTSDPLTGVVCGVANGLAQLTVVDLETGALTPIGPTPENSGPLFWAEGPPRFITSLGRRAAESESTAQVHETRGPGSAIPVVRCSSDALPCERSRT